MKGDGDSGDERDMITEGREEEREGGRSVNAIKKEEESLRNDKRACEEE